LATSISPIFSGLRREDCGPVTDLLVHLATASLRLPWMPLCAQFLGSQVSCLHFRQFCQSCKCSAAKCGHPPTDIGNRLFSRHGHDMGSAPPCQRMDPRLMSLADHHAEPETDCRHHCRRRTWASRRLRGTEAISLNRRADGDFAGDGAVLRSSADLCGTAGSQP
jgi:hypothetical protein